MENDFDFSGWATRNDLLCSDGRVIRKNAFRDCDGEQVPLVYSHDHKNLKSVIGHAILENRDDGVYAYCKLNDSDEGKHAKEVIRHGDLRALSIWANQLKQVGSDVIHGTIRELSLVLAGANPGAYIDFVMAHGDGEEDGFYACYDENTIMLYHADTSDDNKKGDGDMGGDTKSNGTDNKDSGEGKTVEDVINSMTEEQQTVMYAMVGEALAGKGNKEDDKGGNSEMKHNVFDGNDDVIQGNVLSHADQQEIISLAKQSGVGSLKNAMDIYVANNESLAHGFESYEELFPEYELLKKGEPETLERDQSWISSVISKIHKSPIARIRTRQADARIAELRARGYQKKGNYKQEMADIKLLSRTTDPQTVYIKDDMHRDDIIDITDFDVVAYQWRMMRHLLDEELALAALIGDGREDGDPDKIHEDHIRSIWHDEDLYTIHYDVDVEAEKAELQGTNTAANFSDNYVYAEAIIKAALYSREQYKGSGSLDFYCTPHLVNVMLLARDMNGRRIYQSKADLVAALNVSNIYTVEQFENKTRTTKSGDTKKLLGLFVNLSDYQFGSTKGGEITRFEDFDMDFNRYKYMLETRLSGALTKVYSAIALEEPVSKG